MVVPGPDPSRGRRTLSGTPRPDVQVKPHHRRCRVPRPCLPGQAARQAASAGPKRGPKRRKTQPPRLQEQTSEEEEEERKRKRAPHPCPWFIARGSALHSAGLRPSLRPVLSSTSLRDTPSTALAIKRAPFGDTPRGTDGGGGEVSRQNARAEQGSKSASHHCLFRKEAVNAYPPPLPVSGARSSGGGERKKRAGRGPEQTC